MRKSKKQPKQIAEAPVEQPKPVPRPVMEYSETGVEKRERNRQLIARSM